VPQHTDPIDPATTRAGRRISAISIAWTLVGSSFAISFGVRSGSAALVAFGLVGFVDLVGSVALVHHFRHALRTDALSDHFEQRAHRIVTVGLLAIGSVTIVGSAARLAIGNVPETTRADILIASVSLVGLTVLAIGKIRIARAIPSAALRADGFLSGIGATQALVVLAGIVAERLLSSHWADDTAALVVGLVAVAIAVRAGTELNRGAVPAVPPSGCRRDH
jgi:divalent metal cation (Fe/Co/Zn/Cd) transporter